MRYSFAHYLREVPDLQPTAYFGDAAEAFANAARAVWPGLNRLMCSAHVYKVKSYNVKRVASPR